VTVLSTDDPIRVFERFATLDAASNGRAEAILGRGWFTEPFELFGHDRSRYDSLFDAKLNTFVELLRRGCITLQTHGRPLLADRAANLDRRGLDAGIRAARGASRPADDAGGHRRGTAQVSPFDGTVSSRV
jgi:alkanesulfonate monooxygenase SsuD/methylene tetrahydromethanopterin reductase-like flavin-dependent oxidoreductase (luciferase family)